ncbi:MAG TPA: hypothetical protein VFE50_05775 [Cyclobacteriaceae bacterium]|nr:hypothetical protein [Cyclobacteriaceae bacterium]
MRVKFSYLLPGILGVMLMVAYSASAQDDIPVPGPSSNNGAIFSQDPAIYDDKAVMLEQDNRAIKLPDSLQHKIATTPAAKQKGDAKKPQAEGDPLNFNFLYYIIQKFKASEVME